jgi:hypothetical protein
MALPVYLSVQYSTICMQTLPHRLNMELDLQSLFTCRHHYSLAETQQPPSPRIWAHIRGRYWSAKIDLQSLFGLHVHSCTHWLRPRTPLPPHLGSAAKIDDISLSHPICVTYFNRSAAHSAEQSLLPQIQIDRG